MPIPNSDTQGGFINWPPPALEYSINVSISWGVCLRVPVESLTLWEWLLHKTNWTKTTISYPLKTTAPELYHHFVVGIVRKLLWIGTVIAMAYFTFDTVNEVVRLYTSRPVDVMMKMERKDELTFPGVTFCNINPARASAVQNVPSLKAALDTGDEKRRRKRSATGNLFSTFVIQIMPDNMLIFDCVYFTREWHAFNSKHALMIKIRQKTTKGSTYRPHTTHNVNNLPIANLFISQSTFAWVFCFPCP